MAKHGFRMIDAEMHVMEPVDLWERYIDPEFKARAPRRLNERRWDIRTVVLAPWCSPKNGVQTEVAAGQFE